MSINRGDIERRMLPRWRSKRSAELVGELDPAGNNKSTISVSVGDHRSKVDAWVLEPNLSHAIDVLASGLFSPECEVPEGVILQLRDDQCLNSATTQLLTAYTSDLPLTSIGQSSRVESTNDLRSDVRNCRAATRRFSRNAFLWVELARAHVSVGATQKADDEMKVALSLAPLDRFVARSAVRLYTHMQEPDRAHYLLRKHQLLRVDPWLIASELAVSELIGRSSKLIGLARKIAKKGDLSAFHLSEMEGALGSIELSSGAHKKSRKHFLNSLIQPTENSVAQAVWGRAKGHHFNFSDNMLDFPCAYEAKTLQYMEKARWDDAADQCDLWRKDEVFSSRPAEIGSYIAAVALGDPARGEDFCRSGLFANPASVTLKNNLTVCLCEQDKTNDANKVFESIRFSTLDEREKMSFVATLGLLKFRIGRYAEGRGLYEHAIGWLRGHGDSRGAALALVHLANEERVAETGRAEKILRRADNLIRIAKQPELVAMQTRVRKLIEPE